MPKLKHLCASCGCCSCGYMCSQLSGKIGTSMCSTGTGTVQALCRALCSAKAALCSAVSGFLGCCCYKVGTHNDVYCWLNTELCGLFCGLVTDFMLIFAIYAGNIHVIKPWLGSSVIGLLLSLVFTSSCFLAIYCHFKTMCTDPGSVPPNSIPLSDDEEENDYEIGNRNIPFKKFCRKCRAFKPARAHHCSLCGRCIVKMDHQ